MNGIKQHLHIVTLVLLLIPVVMTGCKRQARLADHQLRDPEVGAVSFYGRTLDQQATPEEVVYALLSAVRDDLQADSDDAREAALDKQFDLSAANRIAERNRSSLSRQEFIYDYIYRWTPTISHYVKDFPTSWEEAKERLITTVPQPVGDDSDAMKCRVLLELDDPSGNPHASVVLMVQMVQDKGYWRVFGLEYDHQKRKIARPGAPNQSPTGESDSNEADGGAED